MNAIPQLSFLEPEMEGQAMMVEEINLLHQTEQPLAPFKSSRFVVYPGQTSPVDLHDVKECWFIAAGKGIVTYDGAAEVPVKTGDVLFYDSRKSHSISNTGEQELLIFSVWWK